MKKIRRDVFSKVVEEEAQRKGIEITEQQIVDLMDEVEETVDFCINFSTNHPLEQKLTSFFVAGALFGADGFRRRKETMVMSSSGNGDLKLERRIPEEEG